MTILRWLIPVLFLLPAQDPKVTFEQAKKDVSLRAAFLDQSFSGVKGRVLGWYRVGEEGDGVMGDLIEDQSALAPPAAATSQLLREQVEHVLETLSDRERHVLQLRFGLEDGRSRTLEEVGQKFGLTRERIRQIEAKALQKLRHPSRSDRLRDYME